MEILAEEYESTDKNMESIHLLEQVSVLQPDREEIYVRLGDLYKREKLFKEAINRYWAALGIRNDNQHVHQNLMEIYQQLTQEERAQLQTLEPESAIAQTP